MRVVHLHRPSAAPASGRRPGAASGGFAVEEARAEARTPVGGPLGIGHLGTLIAAQTAGEEEERTRRAIGQGRDLLDLLDGLKLALLDGAPTTGALARLERTLAIAEVYEGDQRLKVLLDQIDLRARVEVAKGKAKAA